MASELETLIGQYTNANLLEQYYRKREEYSPEALAVMQREIKKRNIPREELAAYEEDLPRNKGSLADEDFVPFDHTFTQTDILLVHAILRDANIAFFIDNPFGSSVVPLENEADRRFTIHVIKSEEERAHQLINEHFHREDGKYALKHTDLKDRLRGFSFTEVRLNEAQLEEEVKTDLAGNERTAIASYARRLQKEIDSLEKQDRVVFYFDNIEETIGRMERGGELRMMDLLTILEVLQVYCDDPGFSDALLQAASALLDIFDK
jgi:hypothetical protein